MQPPKFSFFIAFCKLHQILGLVLDCFYTTKSGTSTPSCLGASDDIFVNKIPNLFVIENKLAHWHQGLEEHLKVPSTYVDETETLYVTRQANVLHAR